jgi:hypothetical protein
MSLWVHLPIIVTDPSLPVGWSIPPVIPVRWVTTPGQQIIQTIRDSDGHHLWTCELEKKY